MLGHNETQLDSYNKNIPRATGRTAFIQARSLPTGFRNGFIARTWARDEQRPNTTCPRSTRSFC